MFLLLLVIIVSLTCLLNDEPIQKFSQKSLELSEIYDDTSYANNQYKHNVSVLGRKKEFSIHFRFPKDYQTF